MKSFILCLVAIVLLADDVNSCGGSGSGSGSGLFGRIRERRANRIAARSGGAYSASSYATSSYSVNTSSTVSTSRPTIIRLPAQPKYIEQVVPISSFPPAVVPPSVVSSMVNDLLVKINNHDDAVIISINRSTNDLVAAVLSDVAISRSTDELVASILTESTLTLTKRD